MTGWAPRRRRILGGAMALGLLLPALRRVDAAGPPDSGRGLVGKVMCGYQGWFNCEGDGAGRGWVHWVKDARKPMAPGNVKVDLWPDVSELGPQERFKTGFRHADGRAAEVFSSFKEATVLRHFQWMRDHGIDGVFVQRFAVELSGAASLRHNNAVLAHCREGARRFGRALCVMYDLTGLGADRVSEVSRDWSALRSESRLTEDAAYVLHRGRPLVALWGVGFNDGRKYTLEECGRLVEAIKGAGCAVMLGVPTGWRELNRDSVRDPALHGILRRADIISPWTVGRYADPEGAARHGERVLKPDLAWCRERGLDYLPVVFPGFSWHNMHGGPLDAIPRRRGAFLWSQFAAAKRAGAAMIYVAMFDEVDEGTAIFKCAGDVPVSDGARFLGYEGMRSDFYLRLTGAGGRMLRGEIPLEDRLPFAE